MNHEKYPVVPSHDTGWLIMLIVIPIMVYCSPHLSFHNPSTSINYGIFHGSNGYLLRNGEFSKDLAVWIASRRTHLGIHEGELNEVAEVSYDHSMVPVVMVMNKLMYILYEIKKRIATR